MLKWTKNLRIIFGYTKKLRPQKSERKKRDSFRHIHFLNLVLKWGRREMLHNEKTIL